MATNQKKTPNLAVGIDLGTGNLALSVFDGAKLVPVESPIDGPQTPTIAYRDPKTGTWHFGRDAIMHSFGDTGDNLYIHVKRNLFERPHEKLYGGTYTPIDVTAKLLEHAKRLLLSARPDLADYPQFGGNKHSADELAIIFTTPANWGVEQHAAYTEAITSAGFQSFDGFVAEPVAAARRLARENNVHLRDDDTVLVADVGAGTTDIAVLRYARGVFHQVTGASGNPYLAGGDFTNALAIDIAKRFRVPSQKTFEHGGLNLSGVAVKQRPRVAASHYAAEEAKKKLSVLDEVTVPVEFPKGRKMHTIRRDKAANLWQPLFGKFRKCLAQSLDDTDLQFHQITHLMLVGGSSRLHGLRAVMAEVAGRDCSDILVCTDSEHIVSGGAAEHAFFQDEASQSLESGLGFIVFDPSSQSHKNLLFIEPKKVVPPDGVFLEKTGFQIDTRGGRRTLSCKPFVCRTGVRAAVAPGRDTFVHDSEIVRLAEIEASLERFPEGDHSLAVGVKADPNRNLRILLRPTSLTNVETVSLPLTMAPSNGAPSSSPAPCDILLILDCSGSMIGDKLAMLKRGAHSFVQLALRRGAKVAIIAFPDPRRTEPDTDLPANDGRLLCEFTNDAQRLKSAIEELRADGGTPMAQALHTAHLTVEKSHHTAQVIAVLFTDGMPNSPEQAVDAAEKLKQDARLINVGIGEDVLVPFLRSLASSPEDYSYAECPENIFQSFASVAELVWKDPSAARALIPLNAPPAPQHVAPASDEGEYDNDWEEMELAEQEDF